MPRILTRDELYKLLQRELPRDVYPTGAPGKFYSNASLDAKAKVLESSYLSASAAYENTFPASASDLINNWEVTVFGQVSESGMTLQERVNRLLEKIRSQKGITKPDMEDVVRVVLGSSVDFEIIEWSALDGTGSWIIGVSPLGVSTFLGGIDRGEYYGPNVNCRIANGEFPELSEEDEEELRAQAFTYEVRIYNQTLTAEEEAELDAELTKAEPARCAHVIKSGLTDADKIGV